MSPSQWRSSSVPLINLRIPPNVAKQRLGKNVTAATSTHATTTKNLLGSSFSMRPVLYQGKYAIYFSQKFLLNITCINFMLQSISD
jgi:hypothetical protein